MVLSIGIAPTVDKELNHATLVTNLIACRQCTCNECSSLYYSGESLPGRKRRLDMDESPDSAERSDEYITLSFMFSIQSSSFFLLHFFGEKTNKSMQSPRKKRGKRLLSGQKTPNDKVGKGLRHFSMKVCEKVQQKGTTSYNEVCTISK